jgi:hypothetical protein
VDDLGTGVSVMAVSQGSMTVDTSDWTPARIFMALSALYHLPLGIIGLAIDRTFPLSTGAAATAGSENILGVLETNGWHSLAALLLGVVSLFFAIRPGFAREAALAIGIGHVFLVLALTFWDPSTILLASNGADQVVHVSTAVAATACGLLTPASSRRTA